MNVVDITAEVQQAKARFGIVGNAPALTAAVQRAIRVAPIDLSVLITGESGTGKEFFPKIIHAYGARKHAKYIAVNCGAIPEGTIDSELFGHEKGAFTGAVASRKGYFEEAVQKTNIRVVAATNVNMARAIEEGRFREDLYYRLSTVGINVPPLRERGDDAVLLAKKFAIDFSERYRTPSIAFEESAESILLHYRWPGNVRQLKNVIEQVALFEAGKDIDASTLKPYIPASGMSFTPATLGPDSGAHSYASERELLFNMIFRMRNEIDTLRATIEQMDNGRMTTAFTDTTAVEDYPQSLVKFSPMPDIMRPSMPSERDSAAESTPTLEDTERETIRRALERNEGRRKATAQELNISERTLYRKIKEYGLE